MYRVLLSALVFAVILMITTLCVADEFDQINKDGEISFAMSGQYPPFNFVDEKNELTGFDVEICNEIARRIGVRPRPVTMAWDGIIAGLLAGKYSLICGSMAITEARLKAVDFSDPYYRSGAQLFVRKGSKIASTDQLQGNKIGVTLGTTFETWVRSNLSGVEIRIYKGVPAMILDVANRRLDGFITDRIVGAMAIAEKGAPIQMAGPLLYEEMMGITLAQGNPKLRTAINAALAAMQKDGTYHNISMKWLKIDAR
jgi:polar amino acid transport system substrate-binding protein